MLFFMNDYKKKNATEQQVTHKEFVFLLHEGFGFSGNW